jgi:hypothetical protein
MTVFALGLHARCASSPRLLPWTRWLGFPGLLRSLAVLPLLSGRQVAYAAFIRTSTMALCAICDNLDLRNLTDWDNDLQDVPHHKSLTSVKQSALTCALCDLFFKGLSAQQPAIAAEGQNWQISPIIIRGRQYVDDESNQGGIYLLKVRCDEARASALFGLYTDESCDPRYVRLRR